MIPNINLIRIRARTIVTNTHRIIYNMIYYIYYV